MTEELRTTEEVETYEVDVEEKGPEVETYEVSAEELLTLQLLLTTVGKIQAELSLAQQSLDVFRNNISGRYSEYGKYKLVGEVDLKTRQGKRVRVEE
jgi:hypothetical protein